MNLLLLLSALLSALGGVVTARGGPTPAAAVCAEQAEQANRAPATRICRAGTHPPGRPAPAHLLVVAALPRLSLPASEPIFRSRRRE